MSMGTCRVELGSVLWCFPQLSDASFYDNENYWIAPVEMGC